MSVGPAEAIVGHTCTGVGHSRMSCTREEVGTEGGEGRARLTCALTSRLKRPVSTVFFKKEEGRGPRTAARDVRDARRSKRRASAASVSSSACHLRALTFYINLNTLLIVPSLF